MGGGADHRVFLGPVVQATDNGGWRRRFTRCHGSLCAARGGPVRRPWSSAIQTHNSRHTDERHNHRTSRRTARAGSRQRASRSWSCSSRPAGGARPRLGAVSLGLRRWALAAGGGGQARHMVCTTPAHAALTPHPHALGQNPNSAGVSYTQSPCQLISHTPSRPRPSAVGPRCAWNASGGRMMTNGTLRHDVWAEKQCCPAVSQNSRVCCTPSHIHPLTLTTRSNGKTRCNRGKDAHGESV